MNTCWDITGKNQLWNNWPRRNSSYSQPHSLFLSLGLDGPGIACWKYHGGFPRTRWKWTKLLFSRFLLHIQHVLFFIKKCQDQWQFVVCLLKKNCLLYQKYTIYTGCSDLESVAVFLSSFTECSKKLYKKCWRARKVEILILAVCKINRKMTYDWRVTVTWSKVSCMQADPDAQIS